MVASAAGQISSELMDDWSRYLDPSERDAFQKRCEGASPQAVQGILESFFATWKTTLMHSGLATLKSIASDAHLCSLVKTITIQDDCANVDPYTARDAPSNDITYDIWPRKGDGLVDADVVGITDLAVMLREKQLRPTTIKIRDYQIAPRNLDFCPETVHARDRYGDLVRGGQGPASANELMCEFIQRSDVAVTSLTVGIAQVTDCQDSFYGSPRFQQYAMRSGISGPAVYDAIMTLSPIHQGQEVGFSMLRSVSLDLGHQTTTAHWLQQIFHEATSLESLTLEGLGPGAPSVATTKAVPHLRELTLRHTKTTADEILAILAGSGESLKKLTLFRVTLEGKSQWRKLLPVLARSLPMLSSFTLNMLRENADREEQIDFHNLQIDDLPEECKTGLVMTVKGYPSGDKKVSKLDYNGPTADKVLGVVADVFVDGIPLQ